MKFEKPYLIQRMTMVSKDSEKRFGQRFENDYMGSSEFERPLMSVRLRELNNDNDIGTLVIGGKKTLVLYDPNNYDLDGVEHVLQQIYDEKVHLKESSYFNSRVFREKDEAKRLNMTHHDHTNAWFDIEYGLFWTQEKINIRDVQRAIRLSVQYMDDQHREKLDILLRRSEP